MPKSPNKDTCVSVRLEPGVPDRLRAITGRPFSTIVRTLIMVFIENQERANAGKPTPKVALQQQIVDNLPADLEIE